MTVTIAPRIPALRKELATLLSTALASVSLASSASTAAAVLPVTSCADDGSAGTIRSVLAIAQSRDTIDLTPLRCSRITLVKGELVNNVGTLTIQGPGRDALTIDANYQSRIFHIAGPLTLSGLTITHGRATGDIAFGGCIEAAFGVELQSVDVNTCSAHGTSRAYGGAIDASYFVRLSSSTVSGSSAIADAEQALGGGISVFYGGLISNTSTISGNTASGTTGSQGGGFYVEGSAYVTRSTVDKNVADLGAGFFKDSGIFSSDDCEVMDSTISGNIAGTSGGGFICDSNHPVIGASTITLNAALVGYGGGVLIEGRGSAYLYTVVISSTIVANNTAANTTFSPDIDATVGFGVRTVGYGDLLTSVGYVVPNGYIMGDPMLAPLDDNGGPTPTHALLPGSPAIDAGVAVFKVDTDQRGSARSAGGGPDIGAYEVQPDAIFASGFDSA